MEISKQKYDILEEVNNIIFSTHLKNDNKINNIIFYNVFFHIFFI